MKMIPKALVVLMLTGAIIGTMALKARQAETSAVADALDAVLQEPQAQDGLPKLVDLGADKCIPCKMMAPILEELKVAYAGKMDIQFIDVWKNPDAGEAYGVQTIPTQVFYNKAGKELFRHAGFFGKEDILATWKELGVDLGPPPVKKDVFSRWTPAQEDTRPKGTICYLCDGDIHPRTQSVMETPAGDVTFCSPHCYLITYASMTDENKSHAPASVTDWSTGARTPIVDATYLYGLDEAGRPTIKAFADGQSATTEQKLTSGNTLAWAQLEAKETATRCGFCDRPVYPDDASIVRVDGMQTWGCCVMCALGVAARSGRDIEVEAKDALTNELIRVKTFDGHIAELEPPSAIAWGGAWKDQEGAIKSAGCFKQAFFANEANLKQWIAEHPTATGRQLTIEQALAAKMKLTPQQISKACKIGECAPK